MKSSPTPVSDDSPGEPASLAATYRHWLDRVPAMMHSIDSAGHLVAVSQK
ncbi:MAG: hypothetical protein ACM3X0_16710 [Bacteroidota bacterium]